VDEASRFRNYSKRVVTLRGIGRASTSRYAFTGNLTVRNPADCWYITNFLRPGVWGTGDRKTFITKYFLLGGYTGVEPTGLRPDKEKEFFAILDSMRIQAELSDFKKLPLRELVVRRTDLSAQQHDIYEDMRTELRVEILGVSGEYFESKAKTYASRLLRLQEIAAGFTRNTDGEVVYLSSPKTHEMLESIMDNPKTPTIIWYWFRPEATIIRGQLTRMGIPYSWLGDPGAVDDFMTGKVNIFVAQLAKGGYGFNLTRAVNMEYHTLPWDLDVYMQSQERNRRLTTKTPKQGFQQVTHNIVRGTVEDYVRDKLIGKADMSKRFSRSQALEMLK
jgi:hypothetical protein